MLTALAIGDVNNAEYVATLVPGMTANCRDSTAFNLSYTSNLRDAVTKAGTDWGDVATTARLGYDAPSALPDPSVILTAQTEMGAVSLRDFMMGAHSWHAERGLDVCQIGITHSYRSTTGDTVMCGVDEDMVDGFAYMSSPGAGIASVGIPDVDKDHVRVSAAPHHDVV